MMKWLIAVSLLILLSQLSGDIFARTTLSVPEDYPTIQQAIIAAEEGDCVIVSPGIYFENISFSGKGITVASLYFTTQDSSYIEETIIDGGGITHVVNFENFETLSSVLTGFTIINGNEAEGGGINCYFASPTITDLIIRDNIANDYVGGGILIDHNSEPYLENLLIRNNLADNTGGGIFCDDGSHATLVNVRIENNSANMFGGGILITDSEMTLENVRITGNTAQEMGGGLYISDNTTINFDSENRCSIFSNHSGTGGDIYSQIGIEVIVDTFTVSTPNNFHASPIEYFSFDIISGLFEMVAADLYVSPYGDDANSGLNSEEPLKTINFACSIIIADEQEPRIIHLLSGIYSPSVSGEYYPVNVPPYVNFSGAFEEGVILDAEYSGGVFSFRNAEGSGAENLTITHGIAEYGGGIYCENCDPVLQHLRIEDNTYAQSYSMGGGIYCEDASPVIDDLTIRRCEAIYGGGIACGTNSYPQISNSVIRNNNANFDGGGIFCNNYSSANIVNCVVTENEAGRFGGGICAKGEEMHFENIEINYNTAEEAGGGMRISHSNPSLAGLTISHNTGSSGGGLSLNSAIPEFSTENLCSIYLNNSDSPLDGCEIFSTYNSQTIYVAVDTFTVLHPTDHYVTPVDYFEFEIRNGYYEQENSNLYVSPTGDNANNGLTPEEPFLTIHHALSIIAANPEYGYEIHLAEGTYSPSGTGESFPLILPSYVSLSGEDQLTTIIDAEETDRVMELDQIYGVIISEVTLCGGSAENGGGILITDCNPIFHDMMILSNTAEEGGGGVYCYGSGILRMKRVTIADNTAYIGGGCYLDDVSRSHLTNVTITGNSSNLGGAIHCSDTLLNLVNSILWDNPPHEIHTSTGDELTLLYITHSDLEGGEANIYLEPYCYVTWMEGNIDEDPLFDDNDSNFTLSEDSPCIDSGIAYYEYNDLILVDLSEEEYIGIAPDMGAYEYGIVNTDELKIENVKCTINTYPNPFNPQTTICFSSPEGTENTELDIYNIKGQCVRSFVIKKSSSKIQQVVWDGTNNLGAVVSSGIYLISLKAKSLNLSKKVLLLR